MASFLSYLAYGLLPLYLPLIGNENTTKKAANLQTRLTYQTSPACSDSASGIKAIKDVIFETSVQATEVAMFFLELTHWFLIKQTGRNKTHQCVRERKHQCVR